MSVNKNVPEIRFKGFSGEWEECKLGDIATLSSGGTPSRKISKYWNGKIPWITTTLVDFNIINKAEEYITSEGLENSSAKVFPKNTLLMAMYGQGKTRGKTAVLGIDAATNQACAAIVLNQKVNTSYVFQFLFGRYAEIRELSNAGGQENLSSNLIKQIAISLPLLKEQTAIGNTFQKLDNLINQHQQKHDKLSSIKKAMLEKMFPKQGETAPEIRFKGFSGEWEHFTIGYCSSLITKGTTPMTIGRSFVDSGISFVKVESVDEIGNISQSKFAYIDAETDQILARSRIKENDLLISIAGALGRAAIVKKEILPANTNQALAIVRLKNDSPVKVKFLYHFTKTKDFKDFVDASASQGAQPNLSLGDISNVRILAPKKEEQTAIGNYFQKLDNLINQHQQQITKLNNIKQACLSKMFV
ncbi:MULTISPECIES: restriction endonuclease subunit S [Shewanella]|uniref:restriction endonuclease subunit S n=1 Tax=Shewanella TaxID=22 RepID=UPI000DFE49C2|nr:MULTISPECIES: restriction endonuclease subunit S [Shewanella]MCK7633666.1 restriction endonuclease subunit S [Shewanella sp. JNE17]MCK7648951.1 restriction endonuclease subunit S [Shewanella sp. JNE8]MCK7656972.1 restriction endonuclease subunit S [Shewanella sp. JNE4-2]UPO32639.1 restriction endonuclease subunit S [Shewanella sp. JNE2]SUI60131.1 EcoKI restriction-modification system protein HsdS [Shewanella putrefaciens]